MGECVTAMRECVLIDVTHVVCSEGRQWQEQAQIRIRFCTVNGVAEPTANLRWKRGTDECFANQLSMFPDSAFPWSFTRFRTRVRKRIFFLTLAVVPLGIHADHQGGHLSDWASPRLQPLEGGGFRSSLRSYSNVDNKETYVFNKSMVMLLSELASIKLRPPGKMLPKSVGQARGLWRALTIEHTTS